MLDKISDPYQVYLSYRMGWSPAIERNVACIFAANLGKDSAAYNKIRVGEKPLSVSEFAAKMREAGIGNYQYKISGGSRIAKRRMGA